MVTQVMNLHSADALPSSLLSSAPYGNRPPLPVKPTATPLQVAPPQANHLLLVEDNIHNAKLMTIYLTKLGYQVEWVTDGRGMWQALETAVPSLILMDINLPEVDGLILTQQLRQDSRFQAIPVIAQTALAMVGDREACLDAGATDYITKPLDFRKLSAMLVEHITAGSTKAGSAKTIAEDR
jgi:CheY-like chemotaxis protein